MKGVAQGVLGLGLWLHLQGPSTEPVNGGELVYGLSRGYYHAQQEGSHLNQSMVQQLTREGNMRQRVRKPRH